MTKLGSDVFDPAVREANHWIAKIAEELGGVTPHRAYSALRAVLRTIRDHLPFPDAMEFAASLPPGVRGFALDGWKLREWPLRDPSRLAFLSRVAEQIVDVPDLRPDGATLAVFRLLARRIDEGETTDFRAFWPEPLKAFWPGADGNTAPPSPNDQGTKLERARREIQAAIEGARREGVPEEQLPALLSGKRAGIPHRAETPTPRTRAAPASGLDVFRKSVQKANVWLKELGAILGWKDRRAVLTALQAVLHSLRDRMTVHEALHLGGQLPMILRGFYFDGWEPERVPTKERKKEDFLARVRGRLKEVQADSETVTRGAFAVLACQVTEGEIENIRGRLPRPIRNLWPIGRPEQQTFPASGTRRRGSPHPRARARRARAEIRSTIARARAEGVSSRDLPVLRSRRTARKVERKPGRRRKAVEELPPWYEREQQEKRSPPEGGAWPAPGGG